MMMMMIVQRSARIARRSLRILPIRTLRILPRSLRIFDKNPQRSALGSSRKSSKIFKDLWKIFAREPQYWEPVAIQQIGWLYSKIMLFQKVGFGWAVFVRNSVWFSWCWNSLINPPNICLVWIIILHIYLLFINACVLCIFYLQWVLYFLCKALISAKILMLIEGQSG